MFFASKKIKKLKICNVDIKSGLYELQSALKSSETDYIQKVKNIYTISGRKNKLTKVFTILLLLASCCPMAPTSPSPPPRLPQPYLSNVVIRPDVPFLS